MKFDVTLKKEHGEIVTGVCWSADSQLLSCSDDKQIVRWSTDGEKNNKPIATQVYPTSIGWFPVSGKQAPDSFAVSCTDGTIRFISRTGLEEKKIAAHEGAVILLRWSHDGAALLTCGEDGEVKIWSKSGNLRSVLVSLGCSVYCCAWGPDDDQVVIGNGKALMIKSIQANKKNLQWNAHEGIVLCVDWNVANGNIISGGEDCTYKVWDCFGRQLYSSRPMEHVVTALAWSPNGESFAVGSYNLLRLCDKIGWTHCRERMQSGSILSIQWTNDGTQCACGGGNGSVVFAQVVDRKFEWKNYEVTLISARKIRVQDVATENIEDIELARDRVVEVGLGFDYLIVTTTTQCYIYSLHNLNTPIIFDIRAPPHFIHICRRHFLTLDQISGIQVISFEGRVLSTPKFQNLRPEFLTKDMISLSPDTTAIVDTVDAKNIQVFDSTSGRLIGKMVHPSSEVVGVYLNQINYGIQERILAYVDRNRDLFVAALYSTTGTIATQGILNPPVHKLRSHVESFTFNDDTNALVAVSDGRIIFWHHPEAGFVNKDLLQLVTSSYDAAAEYGRNVQILAYSGNRVSLRKIDGSIVYTASMADIPLLDELVRSNRWEEATRLCRHQKSTHMWACLASLAISKKQLDTAEVALAELDEVPKVEHIQAIKKIPSEEGRTAELALFRRQPDEAERILLQASPPLIYRAIKMNIELFRWQKALDYAIKFKVHIDTVLAYRSRHLQEFEKEETMQKFLQYNNQMQFNWEDVLNKEEQELEDERNRAKNRDRK